MQYTPNRRSSSIYYEIGYMPFWGGLRAGPPQTYPPSGSPSPWSHERPQATAERLLANDYLSGPMQGELSMSKKQPRSPSGEELQGEAVKLEQAALKQPGVEDVLRLYGEYESAMAQIDYYLSLERTRPSFWVSNSTA